MQCSCGDSTEVVFKFKQKTKNGYKQRISLLELDICTGCGRVGGRRLYRILDRYTRILEAWKD